MTPKTRIPEFLRGQSSVKIRNRQVGGKTVCSVRITDGLAGFYGGGAVEVNLPGFQQSRAAFQPGTVLEILDSDGDLVQRNHLLCEKCYDLTGEMVNQAPSDISGRIDAVFGCVNCGHRWEIKRLQENF